MEEIAVDESHEANNTGKLDVAHAHKLDELDQS